MNGPWARIARDGWMLGLEASSVMALRALTIAACGAHASSEIHRMVDEKWKALFALQCSMLTGALGLSMPNIAAKSVAHYRKAVRQNRRRLGSTVSRARPRFRRR